MTPQAPVDSPGRGPWGLFATLFLTLVIGGVLLEVTGALAVPYLAFQLAGVPQPDVDEAISALRSDGLFLGISEPIAGAVALGFVVFFAWVRKGPTVRDYLALRSVPRTAMLWWLLWTALLGAALEGASYLLGYEPVSTWMIDTYRSAGFLPLLLFATWIAAPVLEEIVFRGFLLTGVRRSRLGGAGAVLLAALCWASIHLQYSLFYIGQIFVFGVLLGSARVHTRSIVPPILMHTLLNVVAAIQVALVAGEWAGA